MFIPIIAALLVAGAVAAGSHEKRKAAADKPKLGPDGKPIKVKTEAEIFAEGKTAGRTEAEAEFKRQATHDQRVATEARKAARAEFYESLARAPRAPSPSDDGGN